MGPVHKRVALHTVHVICIVGGHKMLPFIGLRVYMEVSFMGQKFMVPQTE